MKRKDWFWCGAFLFALMMFVSMQGIQEPIYAEIAGGGCALVSALLFGCGLQADTREKSAAEVKRLEEKQKRLEAQRQTDASNTEKIDILINALKEEIRLIEEASETGRQAQKENHTALLTCLRECFNTQQTAILEQIQKSSAAVVEEIQTLRQMILNESKSRSEMLTQLSKDMSTGLEANRTQFKENSAAVTEEVQTLNQTILSESHSHSEVLTQLSKDVGTGFEVNRTQLKESSQAVLQSLQEQYADLKAIAEHQKKEAASYYNFMIDQPWSEIKDIVEMIQSMAVQLDSIQTTVDFMQSGTEKYVRKALEQLAEDSELLREKLESVCKTLETQSREGKDALDRVMQGYSDVTAQDIQVLTDLMRGGRA